MPQHEITVTLISNPSEPHRQMIPDREWKVPYKDRRKVKLTAEPSSTLADVMRRAAQELGIAPGWEQPPSVPAYRRIAFYKPEDETSFASRAMPRLHWAQLVLVDDSGKAIFGVSDQRTVTIEDLLRAAEAGVLEGDPLRPYLIIEPGWGDMPPPDWPTTLAGLEVVWDVLEHAAVIGGAWALADQIRRLRDRIATGKQAAGEQREWAQRGVRPFQLEALVKSRDWKTEELARLLSCSESEAEAVLWILGFAHDEQTGTWSAGGDAEATLIQEINRQIAIASHRGGGKWEEDLRQRITELLETGTAPPVNRSHQEEEELDDHEWRPTAGELFGEMIDRLIARFRRRN